jgi:hypothetical protein
MVKQRPEQMFKQTGQKRGFGSKQNPKPLLSSPSSREQPSNSPSIHRHLSDARAGDEAAAGPPAAPDRPGDAWMDKIRWPYKIHELKTVPPYFDAVKSGTKTFEVRRDDRGFQPGDLLVLREWLPEIGEYSPAAPVFREITYVLQGLEAARFGVLDGFVVLGFRHYQPVVAS